MQDLLSLVEEVKLFKKQKYQLKKKLATHLFLNFSTMEKGVTINYTTSYADGHWGTSLSKEGLTLAGYAAECLDPLLQEGNVFLIKSKNEEKTYVAKEAFDKLSEDEVLYLFGEFTKLTQ